MCVYRVLLLLFCVLYCCCCSRCCCPACCCFSSSYTCRPRFSSNSGYLFMLLSIFIYYERKCSTRYTPWQYSRFCAAPASTYYTLYLSRYLVPGTSYSHYGQARSRRWASARRGEAPLIRTHHRHRYNHLDEEHTE